MCRSSTCMNREIDQLVQRPSGVRATTMPQVLTYRAPSPSWIIGIGKRPSRASSPSSKFCL